jgi:hypothetical protein
VNAFWGNLGATVFGLLLGLVLLEGVFRFLPVQDSLRVQPVNEQSPYAHFAPNQSFTASVNKNFSEVNRGRTNNFGFVNDQDYVTDSPLPSMAVIGDSFVEALLVPYRETIQGRLAQSLVGRERVYSFGMSRSALAQYLAYARFSADTFRSQRMVFVIVANDFDESHIEYDSAPWEGRLHYFAGDPKSDFTVLRKDYVPNFWRNLASYSALSRYLLFNVHLPDVVRSIRSTLTKAVPAYTAGPQPTAPPPRYVGNTLADPSTRRVLISKKSVDTFFKLLPDYSHLDKSKLLFVVDSIRPNIYDPVARQELPRSFVGIMRAYFLEQCRARGIEAIDMDETILQQHLLNGRRFEFATDNHWNGVGHGAAFHQVINSKWFSGITK